MKPIRAIPRTPTAATCGDAASRPSSGRSKAQLAESRLDATCAVIIASVSSLASMMKHASPLRHIEVQRIPIGIPDRPAKHDQVHDHRFCV
jgi:hypothetical protein